MQVEIRIDSSCREPKIIVITDRMTDELSEAVKKLSEKPSFVLAGFQDGSLCVLEESEIIRIYASGGKIYAVTPGGEFTLRPRLYELEERLDKKSFVRISNSEIINLKKVKGFDLSFSGTIRVAFSDGSNSYVSRRYVPKIKKVLGI